MLIKISPFVREELNLLEYWIRERESIRLNRLMDLPRPWTKDPLLHKFRWCNVRRMDDRVSQWLYRWHLTHPQDQIMDSLFSCVFGRLINWPDCLERLPYPVPFDIDKTLRILNKMSLNRQKIFTGAYIINGAFGGPKHVQIIDRILTPLWEVRHELDLSNDSMEQCWKAMEHHPGLGSFMRGQAVADLRHIHNGTWSDRLTWAPLGPGSNRGLNRLMGREKRLRVGQKAAVPLMRQAYEEMARRIEWFPQRCELMDLQNCLCEYDKYSRLTNQEGQVRATYKERLP